MKPGDLYTNRRGKFWIVVDVYTQILWDGHEAYRCSLMNSGGEVKDYSQRWIKAFRWKVGEDEAR